MVSRPNSFATVQLTPIPGAWRTYALECVGTLRLSGWAARRATAEGGSRVWQFEYRGMSQPVVQAVGSAGTVVGEYSGRLLHPGGVLRWAGRGIGMVRG